MGESTRQGIRYYNSSWGRDSECSCLRALAALHVYPSGQLGPSTAACPSLTSVLSSDLTELEPNKTYTTPESLSLWDPTKASSSTRRNSSPHLKQMATDHLSDSTGREPGLGPHLWTGKAGLEEDPEPFPRLNLERDGAGSGKAFAWYSEWSWVPSPAYRVLKELNKQITKAYTKKFS